MMVGSSLYRRPVMVLVRVTIVLQHNPGAGGSWEVAESKACVGGGKQVGWLAWLHLHTSSSCMSSSGRQRPQQPPSPGSKRHTG